MNDQAASTQIVKTEAFSAIETRQNAETSAIAMAAKMRASIEAMCIMAERHPRNLLDVRARMLDECRRPGFCESARYRLPRKKWNQDTRKYETNDITGFTIRFAEAALRYLRNIEAGSEVVYDDDEKLLVAVTVRDYEMNTAVNETVTVPKRVEKKKLKEKEQPLSTRVNSFGDTIFIVPASDDEIAQKKGALVSKSIRTLVLRLLPGDIQDECENLIEKTKEDKYAKDPLAETKKVMDSFARIRVMPEQIAAYLGHDPANITAKEISELRGIYQAISDGDLNWTEVFYARVDEGDDGANLARNTAVDAALEKAKIKIAEKQIAEKQRVNGGKVQASAPVAHQAPASPPPDPNEDGR